MGKSLSRAKAKILGIFDMSGLKYSCHKGMGTPLTANCAFSKTVIYKS